MFIAFVQKENVLFIAVEILNASGGGAHIYKQVRHTCMWTNSEEHIYTTIFYLNILSYGFNLQFLNSLPKKYIL